MQYTVRFCHLKELPLHLKEGQLIKKGELVGTMGSSGSSTAPHLHIDCVQGYQFYHWHLIEMETEELKPNFKQLLYFIDDELFNDDYIITSYVYDPRYYQKFGKHHPAIDIVPKNHGNADMFWNRSFAGQVLSIGFDSGYGNYVHIGFDA